MATKLGPITYTPGASLSGVLYRGDEVFDFVAGAFVALSSATWARCKQALTEPAPGKYIFTTPDAVSINGAYELEVYKTAATGFGDDANRTHDPIAVIPYGNATAIGSGSETVEYVVTDGDGNPVENAQVWIKAAGSTGDTIASGLTGPAGKVVFLLDKGSYDVYTSFPHINFVNPQRIEV